MTSEPSPNLKKSELSTLIHGNSLMAALIRAHDWSLSPLGSLELWSENLLCSVNLMLACAFPSLVFWGKELVQLYNDAFIPLLAERHPTRSGAGGERMLVRRLADRRPQP
jgi:hypothetical protein